MEFVSHAVDRTFLRAVFFVLGLQSIVCANIVVHFRGRLGNQLFQAAAAVALAEEHQCGIYFPDFEKLSLPTDDYGLHQLKQNYNYIFHRLPALKTRIIPSRIYEEPDLSYHPIPYQPNIEMVGYFLSEKHFVKHRDLILSLFSPSLEIEEFLYAHFPEIIDHPKTVAIHVRTGYLESLLNDFNPKVYDGYLAPDVEFVRQGMEMFEEDALFVVFSDHVKWCRERFADFNKNIIFIEDQEYIHDFYLMSKCKHAIIANSSFSWWAAYLNTNPEKKIICRMPFWKYGPESNKDIIPKDWIRMCMPNFPPPPQFN